MPESTTVLITGATGNIGAKVSAHLRAKDALRVVRLDRSAAGQADVVVADLRHYSDSWRRHFSGVGVVLHLAGNPHVDAPWGRLVEDNIDAALNVFEAAIAEGVGRVVFASSLHAALRDVMPSCVDAPASLGNPDNFYGATKAIGERLGRSYSEKHGLSVICLRLGMVRRGDNAPPSYHRDLGVQRRWLSNTDLCRAFERAILAERVDFGVVNVTSRIVGSIWELDSAREVLGFEPHDSHTPVASTAATRLRGRIAGMTGRWKSHKRAQSSD